MRRGHGERVWGGGVVRVWGGGKVREFGDGQKDKKKVYNEMEKIRENLRGRMI